MSRKYIVVEGNIGSGKTEFLNMLPRYFTNEVESSTIPSFDDPIYLCLARENEICKCSNASIFLMEGSNQTDISCLLQVYKDMGRVSFQKENIIRKFMSEREKRFPKPDAIIYIQCSVDTCWERLISRTPSTPWTYPDIERLNDIYEDHIRNVGDTPVIVINGDPEFSGDEVRQQEIIATLSSSLEYLAYFIKNDDDVDGWQVVQHKKKSISRKGNPWIQSV